MRTVPIQSTWQCARVCRPSARDISSSSIIRVWNLCNNIALLAGIPLTQTKIPPPEIRNGAGPRLPSPVGVAPIRGMARWGINRRVRISAICNGDAHIAALPSPYLTPTTIRTLIRPIGSPVLRPAGLRFFEGAYIPCKKDDPHDPTTAVRLYNHGAVRCIRESRYVRTPQLLRWRISSNRRDTDRHLPNSHIKEAPASMETSRSTLGKLDTSDHVWR